MSGNTNIEWTDTTVNAVRARNVETGAVGWHCVHASEGCRHCYAEQKNRGFFNLGTRFPFQAGPPQRGEVEVFLDENALLVPLRWKKPKKIFWCDMSDLFGDWVPDAWIDRHFAVMALTPQHKHQVLTKRSARMREYLSGADMHWRVTDAAEQIAGGPFEDFPLDGDWPLSNVWCGASVENHAALSRIDDLRATPSAIRFVSFEPLLEIMGPVNLTGIHWAIIGGESGPGARPMSEEWAHSLVRQCREAGLACFVKQLGSHWARNVRAAHRKGGDPGEWPADLRVREFPTALLSDVLAGMAKATR